MYERVLLETPFAYFFLAKWLGKKSYLEDLPQLDPELYSGLLFLKNYQGDVSDLCLSFSIDSQQLGETKTIPLIPNGHKVPVTRDNSMQYIYLVANYKLNVMISKPCKYFFRGLSDLINPEWLRMFSESELQILLGGEQTPIDPAEMKKYVIYDGFYDINHPTIVLFWQVVESFSPADRSLLLKFITSCSRPPLLGFGELNQKICIRVSGHGEDRLPSASTCVNLLKLPMYTSFETMSEKLLYAIRSQSGFELS